MVRTHTPFALSSITITDGFWQHKQTINHNTSLEHGYHMLAAAGNFHNLRLAAGQIEGQYRGYLFLDSDLYKWLEAAAYALTNQPDPKLQQLADEVIALVEAAQGDDGYINTYYQVARPAERWQNIQDGHELYCAGHLIEAAVAFREGLADSRLLKVALRFVDYIGTIFGPGKRAATPGHPEIEMALIRLYRLTGDPQHLALAQFFIDQRGHNLLNAPNPGYYQDRTPVREAAQVEGHAVRQLYLLAGVTDLYMETGESALMDALHRQWHDMTSGKLFITGGAGSRHEGETFGEAYELPNDRCYCETCAAIASIFWNWRMLQITGEGRYADLLERTLYNGFLSGWSLDGKGYFYVNPLLSRGGYGRREWYACACCPPNVMRLIASFAQYCATYTPTGIQLHQYAALQIDHEQTRLRLETAYPWNGQVSVVVEQTPAHTWTLSIRVPGWCSTPTLEINDQKQTAPTATDGYLHLERQWQAGDRVTLQLPMSPRLTTAHHRIDPTRGSVALEYGPLVYCLEQIDQPANLIDLALDTNQPIQAAWQPDLLGGIITMQAQGYALEASDTLYRPLDAAAPARQPAALTAVPYHVWGNREPGSMRVWIARSE